MSVRSVKQWIELIDLHGNGSKLAHFVTSDLVGYRTTARDRVDDEDTLRNLFEALQRTVLDD